jgi:hypothetical protein
MTAMVTVCRTCGRSFEPSTADIRAGRWRTCPACIPKSAPGAETRCEGSGRPLTAASRTWCYRCLTGESGL